MPATVLKLLALDTSAQRCSVALLRGDQLSERAAEGAHQHADRLLPLVQALLAEVDCSARELDVIAFGAGPGAFTGMRIACGVAQGLALGLHLPVVPISNLLALAAAADRPRVVAALDARMGEIYHAAYERAALHAEPGGVQWRCVAAPSVCAPASAPLLPGSDWFGAGSGFGVYEPEFRARYAGALGGCDGTLEAGAAHIARLAAQAYARSESVPAHLALPLYVRDKVALNTHEQAELRRGLGAERAAAPTKS